MATHSSILAWKISWAEEPGELHSPWACKESDMIGWQKKKKYRACLLWLLNEMVYAQHNTVLNTT